MSTSENWCILSRLPQKIDLHGSTVAEITGISCVPLLGYIQKRRKSDVLWGTESTIQMFSLY
jgi:hypothetical protein